MSRRVKQVRKKGTDLVFKSNLELAVYDIALALGVELQYEKLKLPYLTKGVYTPDFTLPNGIIIETKGYFDGPSRAKMVAVKKAHPEKDIRFVFSKSHTKVRKGSLMTYADWCDKYGFMYADEVIPLSWIKE